MDLEQKVFQQIKQEDIHIRSRWFFDAQDMLKCGGALLFIAASAVFAGISIALIIHWASEISLVNFPYSLVVLSMITALLAYELLIRSFSLYKIRLSIAVAMLSIVTLSFGYVMFAGGQAESFERKLQAFSLYQKIVPHSFQEYEKIEHAD